MKCTQCNNQAVKGSLTCSIPCAREAAQEAVECFKEAYDNLYGPDEKAQEIEFANTSLL